jgi:hypothetical protein
MYRRWSRIWIWEIWTLFSIVHLHTLQGKIHRQTDKQTNRQTDKQANRQTDKQTNRQTDSRTHNYCRQTFRQSTYIQTDKQKDGQPDGKTDKKYDRQTNKKTDMKIDRHKYNTKERQKQILQLNIKTENRKRDKQT